MFSNPDEFINLENYQKGEQIKGNPNVSTYEIYDKETNTKYNASIFKKDIKKWNFFKQIRKFLT